LLTDAGQSTGRPKALPGLSIVSAALVLLAVGLAPSHSHAERIIGKEDADLIFSLSRSQWEAYARRVIHPLGWETRLAPISTGTGIMSVNIEMGMGLSVQAVFTDDHSTPDRLVVGSWHVSGTRSFTDSLKQSMNQAARHDLGAAYSVSVSFERVGRFDVVELTITKAGGVSKNRPAETSPSSADR
jgi:hypothetical protein